MKKYFNKFTMMLCLAIFSLIFTCCTQKHEVIIAQGGAGDYKVTNISTGESVEVSGSTSIYIGIGSEPKLTAHKGETIKIEFIKAEEYSKYSYDTKFILHDGTVIENENPYEYVIPEATTPGEYRISFSAISTEQIITSSGSLKIIIVE
ncbi:MAG: hypothetical protein IJ628_03410 [Bacteroidaceae bacterium]|nr:hypothetical protein [Bacteroidaceae bacterium]